MQCRAGRSRRSLFALVALASSAACVQPPPGDPWPDERAWSADASGGAEVPGGETTRDDAREADAAGEDASARWVEQAFKSTARAAVDIVILADRSGSMEVERLLLPDRLAGLIAELTTPGDADGDGWPDRPPIQSLHVGIASPDMGTGGFLLNTCEHPDLGHAGCFLRAALGRGSECEGELPAFLSFEGDEEAADAAERVAQFHSCVAPYDTEECGFEQPLKAVLQAAGADSMGGGCNEGFLRPGAALVLLIVTDEDDCSVDPAHREIFDTNRWALGHLNLRCFLHPEMLADVAGYAEALLDLKPPEERDHVVVGVIAGTPPDAPECTGRGDALDGCLERREMQSMIDPAYPTTLLPSCSTATGSALPPRRLVELARTLGPNAWVDSVCKFAWTDAFRAIAGRVRDVLALPASAGCVDLDVPFDGGACRADCWLVETLDDVRPCPDDPGCPSAWCPPPPPDLENVDRLEPCRNPSTGGECVPLERDLGVMLDPVGRPLRRCLVRQTPRDPLAYRCGEPLAEGWSFVPAGWSLRGCDEVRLTPGAAGDPLVDAGSSAALRCRR